MTDATILQLFVSGSAVTVLAIFTLFAMQGYDAAKFVIEAIKKGATSGESIRDYLTAQQDLPALGGPAAFAQDGTLNRPLFLIQVKRGRFTQVD